MWPLERMLCSSQPLRPLVAPPGTRAEPVHDPGGATVRRPAWNPRSPATRWLHSRHFHHRAVSPGEAGVAGSGTRLGMKGPRAETAFPVRGGDQRGRAQRNAGR